MSSSLAIAFVRPNFPHTRFSNDLDFSGMVPIYEDQLAAELNRICDFVQDQTGVTFETDRNQVRKKANSDKERRIFEGHLDFMDFYETLTTTTLKVHLDVAE